MRHFEVFRWGAEFSMLPLHYLALNHMYTVASAIGGVVLAAYILVSLQHARAEGILNR
jgi:hypothetical protein